MLEMETLSPIIEVATEENVEHIEEWILFKADKLSIDSNESINEFISKIHEILV